MPTYINRAMTKSGLVVRNRIEAASKQNLLKTLKENELLPIDVEQIRYIGKQKKKVRFTAAKEAGNPDADLIGRGINRLDVVIKECGKMTPQFLRDDVFTQFIL